VLTQFWKRYGSFASSQLSFHTNSGMYPIAEARLAALVVLQKVEALPPFAPSSNSVPPTAVVYGVDASPFTDIGP